MSSMVEINIFQMFSGITLQVILTEGLMKADVVNALSGKTVLALLDVNSLTQLKPTLEKLNE